VSRRANVDLAQAGADHIALNDALRRVVDRMPMSARQAGAGRWSGGVGHSTFCVQTRSCKSRVLLKNLSDKLKMVCRSCTISLRYGSPRRRSLHSKQSHCHLIGLQEPVWNASGW